MVYRFNYIQQILQNTKNKNIIELLGQKVDNIKDCQNEIYVTGGEFEFYAKFLNSLEPKAEINNFTTLTIDNIKLVIQGLYTEN